MENPSPRTAQFALEVLEYINKKVNEFKEAGRLALCHLRNPGRESLRPPGGAVPEEYTASLRMFPTDRM